MFFLQRNLKHNQPKSNVNLTKHYHDRNIADITTCALPKIKFPNQSSRTKVRLARVTGKRQLYTKDAFLCKKYEKKHEKIQMIPIPLSARNRSVEGAN